jgi:hypothetical protein
MTRSHIACNLNAFDAEEQERQARLTQQLHGAVVEKRELHDGYAFQISVDRLSPTTVVEWIRLEQKCCPFFEFELRFQADQGPIWLRLTGQPDAKDIIRDEFS